jgi:flagellar basal-body rod modification protein FlgD
MSTAAISSNNTTFDISSFNSSLSRTPSSTLDQSDFLQILVTQLQNQDPSSPLSNNDFAQQVTSFSSLDASQKMQSDMSWLVSSSLIGRTVEVKVPNTKNETVTGVVSEVVLKDGVPQVIVDGQAYKLSAVQNIKQPENNSPELN